MPRTPRFVTVATTRGGGSLDLSAFVTVGRIAALVLDALVG